MQVISSCAKYNGHHGVNPLLPSPSFQQVGVSNLFLQEVYISTSCMNTKIVKNGLDLHNVKKHGLKEIVA